MKGTGLPDRIIGCGVAGLIGFTPLAFGTVEPWSTAIMEWGIVTLFLIFAGGRLLAASQAPARRTPWLTGVELPVILFLVLGVAQMIPLPLRLLGRVSPGSARAYEAVDLSKWAGETGQRYADPDANDPLLRMEPPARRPISIDPMATADRLQLIGAMVLLFLLIAGWAGSGQRILFLAAAVSVVGSLVAVEGLIQYLTWNGKIFWFRKVPPSSAFGPFVNRNHFAGYVEMVIPIVIALLFYLYDTRRHAPPPRTDDAEGPGSFEPGAEAMAETRGKLPLALFAAIILIVALLLCQSRGGILSSLASGLILFGLIWPRIASRRFKWTIALAIPTLVSLLFVWVGADALRASSEPEFRSSGEASFQLRTLIWRSVIHNLPNYLVAGSGLGTFEESFAPFTPPGSVKRWDRAHNDYLQLLWETGILGGLLFLAGTWRFVRRYWWPAVRSGAHPLDLFRIGVAVSLLSIAVHSIVDFNLQIGANAFLCSLLAGLLVAIDRLTVPGATAAGASVPGENGALPAPEPRRIFPRSES